MAQHDYDIANGSGAVVRADINANFDAVVTNNSGATAPGTTFPFMFWADTTAGIMKVRNAANTAWISFQNLDGTLVDLSVATADIVDDAVTNAKLRNSAALSVIGNGTNASADPADIVAANDGEVLRRSGTTVAFGTVATAGLANNAVTYAKVQQGTALSVPGVTGNATANLADIVAGTDGHVLRRSGTALAFGTVATAGIAANAVTDAVLRQGAALTVIGRSANTTGNVADIAATAASGAVLRESGSTIGFGTVATAGIAANAITNAKLAQMAQNTIKGRVTASTGDPEDLTAANVKTILALVKADVGLGNVDNTSDATYTASTKTFTNTTFDANGTGNVLSNVEIADFASTFTALSILGRSANTTGAPAAITAVTDGHVLRLSGTTLGFGTVATAGITANAVTDAVLRQGTALTVIGRSANSTGNVADIAATAASGAVLRESGSTIGFGTVATAGIANNAITNAKAAQMAQNTIKGRITASTGDPEDLTAANVKTILALTKSDVGLGNVDNTSDATYSASTKTLTNTTFDAAGTGNALSNISVAMLAGTAVITAAETIAANNNDTSLPTSAAVKALVDGAVASGVADGDKGDITVSSSGTVWTIDANAVTDVDIRQSAGLSVVGRSANTTGNVADITAATDGHVLRLNGTTLAFGTVATAGIADNAITYAKMQDVSATNRILGRITAGSGDTEELTAANVKTILALTKSDVGLGNVDNTSDATQFDNIAGRIRGYNAQTGTTYTFVLGDGGKLVTGNNASAQTFTVPPNSSVAYPVGTTVINLGQLGTGQLGVAAGAGVTINPSGKLKLVGQYSFAALVKYATDTWAFFGDTTA